MDNATPKWTVEMVHRVMKIFYMGEATPDWEDLTDKPGWNDEAIDGGLTYADVRDRLEGIEGL